MPYISRTRRSFRRSYLGKNSKFKHAGRQGFRYKRFQFKKHRGAFKKRVVRAVEIDMEKKRVVKYNVLVEGNWGSTAPTWHPLIDTCWPNQGLNDSDRIGNKIKVRYIVFKISLWEDPTNYYFQPLHIIVVRASDYPATADDYFDQVWTMQGSLRYPLVNKGQPPIYWHRVITPRRLSKDNAFPVPNAETSDQITEVLHKIRVMKVYNKVNSLNTQNNFNKAEFYIRVFTPIAASTNYVVGNPKIWLHSYISYTDD